MKKILLLPVLLILVLTGCKSDGAVMLVGDGRALVYAYTKHGAAEISVSPNDAAILGKLSGKSLEDSLEEIFSPETTGVISGEQWTEREGMLALVARETGARDNLEVLTKYGDGLIGKEFMDIMDELSGSFDDEALAKMLSRRGGARKYDLGAVLSSDSSWSETVSFVKEWTRQISLKDNMKVEI